MKFLPGGDQSRVKSLERPRQRKAEVLWMLATRIFRYGAEVYAEPDVAFCPLLDPPDSVGDRAGAEGRE
jgi:hypothetical protein